MFKVEAAEHVQALASGLIALEQASATGERAELIEAVFREAHSLKGAARAVGMGDIEALCQSTESTFAALKRGERDLSAAVLDELHGTVSQLGNLLGQGAPAGDAQQARGAAGEASPGDTVRVRSDRLDGLLLQTEELVSAKQAVMQRAADIRDALGEVAVLRKNRVSLAPASLAPLEARLAAIAKAAEHDQRALGAMVDSLLGDVKEASMLPVASVLEVLPKMARDLARDLGKELDLVLSGGEMEVDRRILAEMRDPLIHLVRNAIDHGVELPEIRRRASKAARGTVTVAVGQKGAGMMEIVVTDDGAGIDREGVQAAAHRLGVAPSEGGEGGDEDAALQVVFRSGLSTSPIITDLSGRGLGLAIVREKAERLGGTVSVETVRGGGTTFRLLLPLRLATFRGVHVRANGQHFVVPSSYVERCVRVAGDEIRTVENREVIHWHGQAVAFLRLADALELPRQRDDDGDRVQAIIVRSGGRRIAFAVDEILGDQEFLVKSLGRQLVRVRNIAGATVLANGKAVPVVSVPDLLHSAIKASATARAHAARQVETAAERKSILVAEDSIISRALLTNILESAGYRVVTAVDGVDAFTLLHTQRFDLVVSDVEMPRMSGFDLTARIRADKALAEMPVVLVTALESREHRERGVDVGANAYIVKSSFDQGSLLDIVGRLL
jgi:two-component system chemotaxis sensor kinase CheA